MHRKLRVRQEGSKVWRKTTETWPNRTPAARYDGVVIDGAKSHLDGRKAIEHSMRRTEVQNVIPLRSVSMCVTTAAVAFSAAVPGFAEGGAPQHAARISFRTDRIIAAPPEEAFRLWTDPKPFAESTASQVTVVLVDLILSAGSRVAEPLQVEVDFKQVYSLPVVELATSEGKLRLVVDTASNLTSLLRAPKCLKVKLAGREIRLYPVPIQTPEFAGFNAAAHGGSGRRPAGRRLFLSVRVRAF